MSVVTRLDSRSTKNNSFHIVDAESGKLLVVVQAVGKETQLAITSDDSVRVVKSNGTVLKRK